MLINPISFRLSVSIFWKSTWSLYNNKNYKYLFYSDLIFFEFFFFFFKKMLRVGDYKLSHIRLYRIKKCIIINSYYYSPIDSYLYDDNSIAYFNDNFSFMNKRKSLNTITKNKSKNDLKIKNIQIALYLYKKIINKKAYNSLKKKLTAIIRKYILKKGKFFLIYQTILYNWYKKHKNYLIYKLNIAVLNASNKYLKLKLKKFFVKESSFYKSKFKKIFIDKVKTKIGLDLKKFIKKQSIKYIKIFYKNTYKKYENYRFNNLISRKLKKKPKIKKLTIFDVFTRIKNAKQGFNIHNWKKKENKNWKYGLNIFKKNIELNKKLKTVIKSKKVNIQKYIQLKKKKIKKKKNNKNVPNYLDNRFSKYNIYTKITKVLNKEKQYYIKNNNLIKSKTNLSLFYLFKMNLYKMTFNFKFIYYNIYYYLLSKLFIQESKSIFFNFLKKLKINIFKITLKQLTAQMVTRYIKASFKANYSLWETIRPVLLDLNKRLKFNQISGFKLSVSGRFKRALRATYWWKREGRFLISTPSVSIDYERILYRTKYGVSAITVWLTTGKNVFKPLIKSYPIYNPFFFSVKENYLTKIKYFIIKKNELFFLNNLKRNHTSYSNFNNKYYKNYIIFLLYKNMYTHIFTKKLYSFNYKQVQKIKKVSLQCLNKINILKINLISLKKKYKYYKKYKKLLKKNTQKCIKQLKNNIKKIIFKISLKNEINLRKEKKNILNKCFIIIKMLFLKKITFKNSLHLINNLIQSYQEKNYLLNIDNKNKILFLKLQNENKINNIIYNMLLNYKKKIKKKKNINILKKNKVLLNNNNNIKNLELNIINNKLQKNFLPHYCIYKLYLENFYSTNYIKIVPFINLTFLKRINIRNSYKIESLKNKKLKLKTFKYKIMLY